MQQDKTLYLSYAELMAAGDIASLARSMSSAYADGLADVIAPLRSSIQQRQPFFAFHTMPAYSRVHQIFIAKIGTVVPKKDPRQESVHAMVIAFSAITGRPIAIFDGDAVTHLKCAAVTAWITNLCASEDAQSMCLIGTGIQAREQLRGVLTVRPLKQVNVYSRSEAHVEHFIRENQSSFPGVTLTTCRAPDEAANGTDIVSTATTSIAPVVSAQVLDRKGLHINCFGNHTPHSRELPIEILEKDSILIVEDLLTAIAEAGEVHRTAIPLDRINDFDVEDLKRARTVFSSTGHAFLDLLAVDHLIENLGLGREN